ncbi:MAG TPA: O-antigen ligase family protein [Nitrospira sp.]|nr:O-antigen ligase family protein [Nitrospira sp.]
MHKDIHLSAFDADSLQPFNGLHGQSRAPRGDLNEIGILLGLMFFVPLIDGGTTYLPILILRLVLIAWLTIRIFRSLRDGTLILYRSPMLLPVVVFLGVASIGIWHSSYTAVSIQGVVGLFMYTVFFFLLFHQHYLRASLRVLTLGIISLGLLEGLLGVIQYLWLGEIRAKGTFFNPNMFAAYEAVTVILTLSLLAWMKWTEHGWADKGLIGTAFGISLLAFVMAQSRGALGALLVALLFVGLCRSWKLSIFCPLAMLIAVITFPNPIKQRVLTVSDQDQYAYTRFDIWRNSLNRIADHPLGTGLGTYKHLSFKYRFPLEDEIARYGKRAESAHNEYLQMAVELGVGGLVLFVVGVGIWGWEVKEVLRRDLSSWERGTVVGVSGGALVILAHAAVDSLFHEPALVLLLILCGSTALIVKRFATSCGPLTWAIPFPYHPARAVLVCLLATASALLVIQPAAAWFAYEQGNTASQSGHIEQAGQWYHRAILIDPGITAYRDAAARINVSGYYASGDPQRLISAVDEMVIAQQLNPLDGRTPSRLGMLYVLLAKRAVSIDRREDLLAQAARAYEGAINVDPFSPFNYVELGAIRWRQGNSREAQVLLAQCLDYEPNFLPARALLAQLATETGHNEIAHAQHTAIERIQAQYKGRAVSPLERRFLSVDLNARDQEIKE